MENKSGFNSNFGFLMAVLGSAIGLGNLWGFSYKVGANGGAAFLLLYVILLIFVGYPLVLAECAFGRKTGQGAIEAYTTAKKSFRFNGVLQTIVPLFLIAFYCTFGGYMIKYLVGAFGAFFGKGLALYSGGETFGNMLGSIGSNVIYVLIFIALTVIIVLAGVSGGIEKFCKIGMPALFVMLIILIVKAATLPGAGAGYEFLFKPDFGYIKDNFFTVLVSAGDQMFFSLSLASACLIAYGSYLDKGQNLEKDAVVIVIGDTLAALFAGMAIIPAAIALGGEGAALKSVGLLFITMTDVFQNMGAIGPLFQLIFWVLVFIAVLSSSIGMLEGAVAAIVDTRKTKGKKSSRTGVTLIITAWIVVGNLLTTVDSLGGSGKVDWLHILGQGDVLSVWDAIAEGVLMPLTGLIMAILLGWVVPGYIDDEVELGRKDKYKKFVDFCLKYIGPIFMALLVYGKLKEFFIH